MSNYFEEQIKYLNSPITSIKGIGPKKGSLFERLGIRTIWDLVYYFPSSYDDRRVVKKISECIPGELCCIKVRAAKPIVERRLKQKLSLFLLYATDGNDSVVIKWFSAPFSKPKVYSGRIYTVYGSMNCQNGRKEFELRYIEDSSEPKFTEKIVPIYRATTGLPSKQIAETVFLALENVDYLSDCLPDSVLKKHSFPSILETVRTMHNPTDFETLKNARQRLAFEELLVLSLALSKLRSRRINKDGIVINATPHVRVYADKLPFELTDGQKKAINDICADLKSGKPMNRLVQGDVGCGKTAVAAAALYALAKCGYQSAFMTPTEILAQQHYATLKQILGDSVKIALLTSTTKNKKTILEDIAKGDFDIVVGTHALIQEKVSFANLALCITDEQHRFGVNQRAVLSSKGKETHILVMSATPIPRTLSLILYGDLDISVIKSMPKGRQSVDTFHIASSLRSRAYGFVKKEVDNGRQCYVVCPLVEESEIIEASSVENIIEELRNTYLSGLSVECVHGKMKADEKDRIMKKFKDKEIDVLVSTTVIEVGVDVANATVMLIENAERFGLSQLHQLRGRVGRGEYKSYCILVSDGTTDSCKERMKIMTQTSDGFVIAQKDLELRGSGQFFGTRQHGVPELKVANLFSDSILLKEAMETVDDIISLDPDLSMHEHSCLKGRIDALFDGFDSENIFN
ncbi:MAG: ATP-dependent DNA helicase RecG [Clostridia bacterium]|nr:ATP-dependent DNA helicase RecG [Clostridia bacterium]